jgi:isoleucyl-tRNA synthetase
MVERTLYPLLPVVGPRNGKAVGAIMAGARSGDWQLLDDGRVTVGGVTMEPDEFQLTARARPGHEVAEEGDLLVALDTELTPELEAEGLAREVAHRLQTMRKAAGYEISDRVEVSIGGDQAAVARLEGFREWLAAEVLAVNLRLGAADGSVPEPDLAESLEAEGQQLDLAIRRA